MNILKFMSGYLAGVLCIVALYVYLRAILSGKVHSNKVTWGTWIIVTLMLCFSYYQSADSTSAIWVSVAYAVGTIAIYIALVFYSKEGSWTWVEKSCLVALIPIIIIWWWFNSSVLGLTLTMIVDVIGLIPLVYLVYKKPKSEYALAWWLGFLANFVNLFAIDRWDWANSAYPIYLALMTLTVAVLVQFPRFLRIRNYKHP